MPINISTAEGIFRWRPACWLRVTGEDAFTFLQGQLTNDLRRLEEAQVVYGLWLTLKGKVLADSFVLKGVSTGEFWVGSYFSPAAVIRERLESHVIADDVVIDDVTGAWAGTCLLGMKLPAEGGSGSSSGFLFPGRRSDETDFECVYPVEKGEPAEVASMVVPIVDRNEMERRRIAAGIPSVPVDVGPADLPNEAGLEETAISYTKGCYLGQEVMARLKSMGQVRRRLWRVRGDGTEWPALPAAVFAGSRHVGELRSAAGDGSGGWLGLAMVTLMHVAPGAELSFAAGGAPKLRLNASP
jgi:folate-binding protein YgfZ